MYIYICIRHTYIHILVQLYMYNMCIQTVLHHSVNYYNVLCYVTANYIIL